MTDCCLICGAYVPEGREVCPACQSGIMNGEKGAVAGELDPVGNHYHPGRKRHLFRRVMAECLERRSEERKT